MSDKPKLEEMKFRAPYRAEEKVAYSQRPDLKATQMQLDQAGKVEDPPPMLCSYCRAAVEAWYCWEESLLLVRASVESYGDYTDRRFREAAPPEAYIFQMPWNIAVEHAGEGPRVGQQGPRPAPGPDGGCVHCGSAGGVA